jgi:hypothetical protein
VGIDKEKLEKCKEELSKLRIVTKELQPMTEKKIKFFTKWIEEKRLPIIWRTRIIEDFEKRSENDKDEKESDQSNSISDEEGDSPSPPPFQASKRSKKERTEQPSKVIAIEGFENEVETTIKLFNEDFEKNFKEKKQVFLLFFLSLSLVIGLVVMGFGVEFE